MPWRAEPNPTCLESAGRFGIVVVLAKRGPTDKVKAEAYVQHVESRILESLREFGELDPDFRTRVK